MEALNRIADALERIAESLEHTPGQVDAQASERIKKGMKNAQMKGTVIGRPSIWSRPGFAEAYRIMRLRMKSGEISRRQAAMELGIGYATLKRTLDGEGVGI